MKFLASAQVRAACWTIVLGTSAILVTEAEAQSGARPNGSSLLARGDGRPSRRLAAGVLVTIPSGAEPADTRSVQDLLGVVRGMPQLEWTPRDAAPNATLKHKATNTILRRTVWGLEFSFKPLRMMWVDVPQPGGFMKRQQVWYLMYRVRNLGGHLQPAPSETGAFDVQPVDDPGEPIHFHPRFLLHDHEGGTCYPAELIPVAVGPIRQREDPALPLLNMVEIGETPVPLSTESVDRGVWGVATWGGIRPLDQRIDFFSVYVVGLTNAHRWEQNPEAFRPDDPPGSAGTYHPKVLQLNFWRPGDELDPNEREIRYGVPLGKQDIYGQEDPLDHRWIYENPCDVAKPNAAAANGA